MAIAVQPSNTLAEPGATRSALTVRVRRADLRGRRLDRGGHADGALLAMRASVTLARLADRVSAAEDALQASKDKGRDELRAQADAARAAVTQSAADMKREAAAAKDAAGTRWTGFHDFWDEHVAKAHADVAHQRVVSDADHAEHRAECAETDARLAVQLAHAAVEDAEYSLLESALARMEADDAAVTAAAG